MLINKGALSLTCARSVRRAVSAVAALHERGLVHRDLSRRTFFVVSSAGGQRHAVLLDFGIAEDLSRTPRRRHARGQRARYASVHGAGAFFGQPAGLATDIYELALCCNAMLAGGCLGKRSRIPSRDCQASARRARAVPEPLDVEIRRALSTRAQNRPASAQPLHSAVIAAATANGTVEPTAGETARMRSVLRKFRTSDQATPLAWAPTQAARRRLATFHAEVPWIAAISGGVIAASGRLCGRVGTHEAVIVNAWLDLARTHHEARRATRGLELIRGAHPEQP